MLAIEAGLPIVPVAVDGGRFVMRKGRLMTCPGRVTLKVLEPIPTAGLVAWGRRDGLPPRRVRPLPVRGCRFRARPRGDRHDRRQHSGGLRCLFSRRQFLIGITALAGGALAAMPSSRPTAPRFKVGVTDWNLRQTMQDRGARARPIARVRRRAGEHRPRRDRAAERAAAGRPALQRPTLPSPRSSGFPIASLCLDILHRNYLKNDPLGQRWVAESVPIATALGVRVILLAVLRQGRARNDRRDGLCRRRAARSGAGRRKGRRHPRAGRHHLGQGQRPHHGALRNRRPS